MSLGFAPNCLELMLDVVRETRPDLDAKVYFTSHIPLSNPTWLDRIKHILATPEAAGCTMFPDDGSIVHIQIHTKCTVEGALEVLAHELAHLAVGPDREADPHGPLWQVTFDDIYERWSKKMEVNYDLERVKG